MVCSVGMIAVLFICLMGSSLAQPPGSNAGLPPSAYATGLAPQKLVAKIGETLMVRYVCGWFVVGFAFKVW